MGKTCPRRSTRASSSPSCAHRLVVRSTSTWNGAALSSRWNSSGGRKTPDGVGEAQKHLLDDGANALLVVDHDDQFRVARARRDRLARARRGPPPRLPRRDGNRAYKGVPTPGALATSMPPR